MELWKRQKKWSLDKLQKQMMKDPEQITQFRNRDAITIEMLSCGNIEGVLI